MQRLLLSAARNCKKIPSGVFVPATSGLSGNSALFGDLRWLSTAPQVAGKNDLKVKFIKEGKTYEGYGKPGDTLLDVIINNELDFDGYGACEGTLACSTCHVILSKADYDRLPNKPCDEELDMLDLAYDLTKTSRLGCQIEMSKDLDGFEVTIPSTRHDARG